ncbi:MAG: hypothetical protein M3Z36_04425, partial [Acidobacteriota bacterium]|nr:hypothetical protein [Acidobacteriota bacterium]
LKLPLAASLLSAAPRKDEYQADNTKIATMIDVHKATDDDLMFLKQIGLRWIDAEFGSEAPDEFIKSTQERLARYGIKIHSGFLDTYCTARLQLGRPGRDKDIAGFRCRCPASRFL